MERYVIWYVLSLKNYWKKRSSYLTILGMIVLIWIISGISAPNATNMKVGLCSGSSAVAEEIQDVLLADKSDFAFLLYEKEDELIQDVISGRLDSGFVFSDEFDQMFEQRDTRNGIQYYKTTFSTKGEVLKEKIFAEYFKLYSKILLEDMQEDVFGNQNPERLKDLLEKNKRYMSGDSLFKLDIKQVEDIEIVKNRDKENSATKGLILLSIFLIMFLSYAETRTGESDSVSLALNRKEQFVYQFVKRQAAAIFPAIMGMIVSLQISTGGNVFYEMFRIGIFLILSGLWINVLGKKLGKAEQLPTWLLSMVILHIVLCPIFYDFSVYLPAIKWIRNFIPLGIYYML